MANKRRRTQLKRVVVYVWPGEHRAMRKLVGEQTFSQWVRGHMQNAIAGQADAAKP